MKFIKGKQKNLVGGEMQKIGDKKVPDWIQRLYENAGLHVEDHRLAWNAVHVEQFLATAKLAGEVGRSGGRDHLKNSSNAFLRDAFGRDTRPRVSAHRRAHSSGPAFFCTIPWQSPCPDERAARPYHLWFPCHPWFSNCGLTGEIVSKLLECLPSRCVW